MRGERGGGLLLGRFYFSKWLTFPVLGHKKVLVDFVKISTPDLGRVVIRTFPPLEGNKTSTSMHTYVHS